VGRAELLASLFYLTSILAFGRASQSHRRRTSWRWVSLAVVLAALSMLSKEQGITVVAVCVVYELVVTQRASPADVVTLRFRSTSWLRRVAAVVASAVALLAARLRVMGDRLPVFTKSDNPAAAAASPARQLTFNYLAGLNAWLLLSPCDLICDWTSNTVALVESVADPRNLLTVLTCAAVALLARSALKSGAARSHGRIVSFGLALLVLPFLPASNLFFPVGFVVAERVLYLPSMGFCLLVAYGFSRLYRARTSGRWRVTLCCCAALLGSAFAAKTLLRNLDWKDELTLFTSGLKVTRQNAKLFNNVGHALESRKDFVGAMKYFEKAVTIQPDDIGTYINLGRTYNHLKMYKEAEETYLRAKSLLPASRPGETYQARVAPNHLNVFVNLATLISRNGTRLEEADLLYRQAISMRADYTQAYINRGDILLKLNRTKEAQEVYETALTYEQDNPDLLYNLAVVLLNQGEYSRAMAYLNKALEHDPDHYQALLNSAILIQETGSVELRQLAFERLMKIVDQGKVNERVFFNLGMLSMDNKDSTAAEKWFRKAVEVKPDFRSALFNLALLLSETGRSLESAPFLQTLLWHNPDHVKGLILLGDLYVNHLRDLPAAERCYRHILRVDPDNIQAQHNLCVVMVEAGDLPLARDCLRETLARAPTEEYIAKHLAIVEDRLEQQVSADAG
jgi:tetratricopeptide (TPR) repeat protein